MRLVLATLTAVLAALLGLGTLAAVNLHSFIEAQRDELRERGARALERPVTIGAVTASWWPLGIRLADVTIGDDPRFGTRPFLEAAAVRIRVRAWPLALGRVEAAGFVLDRPRVLMVRDAGGRWNVSSLGSSGDAQREGSGRKGGGRRRGLRVPVEWTVGTALSEIRDGRLEVEDRSRETPRRLTVEHLRLRAENVRFGAEARLRADAALFPTSARADTHLDLRVPNLGANDAERTPFSATIELEELDLATVAALAQAPDACAGRVSHVSADASGTLERFTVMLAARSERTRLRLGRQLALPAVPLSLDGRAIYERGRVVLEETSGTFGTLAFTASGAAALDPWRVELAVRSSGGSTIDLPLLEPPVGLRDLVLGLAFEDGAARVDAGRFLLDGAPVEISGDVTSLDPPVLAGRFAARVFGGSLEGTIGPGDDDGRLALRAQARGLDAGALFARLAPRSWGRISGRTDGTVALAMTAGAGATVKTMTGSGTLTLVDATVYEVNVAEHVLGHVREVGLVPRLLSARTRARYPEIFDARHTVVQTASAPFTIADGRVTSERMSVQTEPYEVVGGGWIDFGGVVRFQGDLVLSSALSSTLRADVPAAKYLLTEGGRVSVPFRLRGPLGVARAEPDVKRLRAQGLKVLREARAEGRDESVPDQRGGADRPPADATGALIERLERMLKP